MDLFQSKKATDAFEDINANASSLQYHEILPKSQPATFDVSTQLQFDFGGSTDRYVLMSESYFHIKYKVGFVNVSDGTTAETLNAMPDDKVYKGDGTVKNADDSNRDPVLDTVEIVLQPRFFNHCVSNIRYSINGVMVESTNEPATAARLRDLDRARSYDLSAGSAYRTNLVDNFALSSESIEQECAYQPPLGIADCKVPIGGAQHSITFDLANHTSYNAAVFRVSKTGNGSPSEKIAADFQATIAQATAGLLRNRESYCFGIQEITLMLCTVQPQSMMVPGPSLLLENRSLDVLRVDNTNSRSMNKQVQLPGSTYRTDVFFSGQEPNGMHCRPIGQGCDAVGVFKPVCQWSGNVYAAAGEPDGPPHAIAPIHTLLGHHRESEEQP